MNYPGVEFKNAYPFEPGPPIPYVYFDSVHHQERYLFYIFLQVFLKKFALNDLKQNVVRIYLEVIQELLDQQVAYDELAGKLKLRKHPHTPTTDNPEELKKLYREVAKLCHPDLFLNEQDKTRLQPFFVALTEAFHNQSLFQIQQIKAALLG